MSRGGIEKQLKTQFALLNKASFSNILLLKQLDLTGIKLIWHLCRSFDYCNAN